ncbi:hypothetical protein GSI_11937 [Ganoderma sinense ZZ0214-1]|uniref:Uncharacterized protein n=1 Tax=Ganoderma sinense ZZ0214-1 TaxID=1077348 RepID=A0A2G8RXF3_9APHY|nr:hypothetical protein GSI_11937 [Ganoderma sinense ZZ0214-1]
MSSSSSLDFPSHSSSRLLHPIPASRYPRTASPSCSCRRTAHRYPLGSPCINSISFNSGLPHFPFPSAAPDPTIVTTSTHVFHAPHRTLPRSLAHPSSFSRTQVILSYYRYRNANASPHAHYIVIPEADGFVAIALCLPIPHDRTHLVRAMTRFGFFGNLNSASTRSMHHSHTYIRLALYSCNLLPRSPVI